MTIRLGVPSKGRLMEKTFDWFGARGITLMRSGSDREYAGAVEGVEDVSLILLSASEVPRELAAGRLHFGVTGTDLIEEKLPLWEQQVEPVAELGFGFADLVIAVPKAWIDVDTIDDLVAALKEVVDLPAGESRWVWQPKSRRFVDTASAYSRETTLSPKEREVFMLMRQGLQDKQIADRINRSIHTVRVQIRAIRRKRGASRRAEVDL